MTNMEAKTKTNSYIKAIAILAALAVLSSGLVAQLARPAEAAFPGDNGKIVFASTRTTGQGVNNPEGDFEIFTMNADGSNKENRSKNAANDLDPAFSPDGTKIAFNSDRNGNLEIYKMNAGGKGQKRLTENSATDGSPDWQPKN